MNRASFLLKWFTGGCTLQPMMPSGCGKTALLTFAVAYFSKNPDFDEDKVLIEQFDYKFHPEMEKEQGKHHTIHLDFVNVVGNYNTVVKALKDVIVCAYDSQRYCLGNEGGLLKKGLLYGRL